MNLMSAIRRMDFTRSIGDRFEWLEFKKEIISLMYKNKKHQKIFDEKEKQLKAENRKLRVGLTSAVYSNKKHVEDKAALKKALSVLLNDNN